LIKDNLRFSLRETASRFIQNEEGGALRESGRNANQLPLRRRQQRRRTVGRQITLQRLQRSVRALAQVRPIDDSAPQRPAMLQSDVFRDR
jgi:hypothetical protein